ncbi:LrgB family protein [Pararhodobacter sp. SW119]|uniref:LrgB family protein n=1 Tax=Pararhodobacter sp. SW119 TaxID=2780075 RepID=UPI001ADF3E55|nr:LrgB family protein [Pararhodobacter sp. SW119]
MADFAEIWSYLARGPLVWLTLTLVAYVVADALSQVAGRAPLANPVLIAVILLALTLWGTGTPYAVYFEGAQFVHFLLGPATVALAVPLYQEGARLKRAILPVLAGLAVGSVVAVVSALWIARALGVAPETLAALAPKSTTAPVAIGIAQSLGGSPTLAAVLVLLTGIIGAIVATPLLNALGVRDWRARGLATGVAAHGIGTARALQVHPQAGAFAGIGMGLNAILTALLAPAVLRVFL